MKKNDRIEEHVDVIGKPLMLGDLVCFSNGEGAGIVIGTIERFTPKNAYVRILYGTYEAMRSGVRALPATPRFESFKHVPFINCAKL